MDTVLDQHRDNAAKAMARWNFAQRTLTETCREYSRLNDQVLTLEVCDVEKAANRLVSLSRQVELLKVIVNHRQQVHAESATALQNWERQQAAIATKLKRAEEAQKKSHHVYPMR